MARLLIVSRSMALAMRLADQHDVIEHPADELDILTTNLDTDVLVLDVGDAMLAVNTVNSLREAENATPVLLVSGYQPEWEQVEAQQVEGVHVVPLPITRLALLDGIAMLTGEQNTFPIEDSGPIDRPRPSDPQPAGAYGSEPYAPDPYGIDPEPDADPEPASAELPELPQSRPPIGPAGSPTLPPASAPTAPPVLTGSGIDGLSYADDVTLPFAQQSNGYESPEQPPHQQPHGPPAYPTPEPPRPAPAARAGRGGDQPPSEGHWWLAANPTGPEPAHPVAPAPRGGNGLRLPRLGSRGRKLQRHPSNSSPNASAAAAEAATLTPPPGLGLMPDPFAPPADPRDFGEVTPERSNLTSALDRRLDAEAAALTRARPAGNGVVLHTSELVQLLHDRSGELYGVSDTAQVLADDVIERADADAAAVLVPDGPLWRVSGGVGLRPLERRLVLEDSHWLIAEIGSAGRAVLIEDTDIIRQQLAGAPLAAWRHLLAVPVPDVRAIVVLARGGEGGPFTDRELSAVISPVREAAALLAQAVQTRKLARLLGPLREQETQSPIRKAFDP